MDRIEDLADDSRLGEPAPGALERLQKAIRDKPKPDESRLMTDDRIFKLVGIEYYCNDMDTLVKIAKAQLAEDLAFEQARVERIFKEIEKEAVDWHPNEPDYCWLEVPRDKWLALKKQEGIEEVKDGS